MDQAYMRADQLAGIYKPEVLIFSFFPDDIKRCELSVRMGAQKPYFEPQRNGELKIMNTPVPEPITPAGRLRDVLGHSYMVHTLMMKTRPGRWLVDADWRATKAHSGGLTVARSLLSKLETLAEQHAMRVYVLVQYGQKIAPEERSMVDHVLAPLAGTTVRVVDLRDPFDTLRRDDPERYRSLFDAHMTPTGNEYVAGILEEAISN
jgi:hypothetical protein